MDALSGLGIFLGGLGFFFMGCAAFWGISLYQKYPEPKQK